MGLMLKHFRAEDATLSGVEVTSTLKILYMNLSTSANFEDTWVGWFLNKKTATGNYRYRNACYSKALNSFPAFLTSLWLFLLLILISDENVR